MKTVENYFREYSQYHQTPQNRMTHFFGIPMIMISIIGLLDYVSLFKIIPNVQITLSMIIITLVDIFYLKLNQKLGLIMTFITIFMYFISLYMTPMLLVLFFIFGWALQLYGHKSFEKKAPAFLDNLIHLLIGPLFILNELVCVVKI
jgi:uncharacterized membrane protein YGL010W